MKETETVDVFQKKRFFFLFCQTRFDLILHALLVYVFWVSKIVRGKRKLFYTPSTATTITIVV